MEDIFGNDDDNTTVDIDEKRGGGSLSTLYGMALS